MISAGSENIVWKDTQEIGLAVEQADDYYAVMALYKPAFIMDDPEPSDSTTPGPSDSTTSELYNYIIMYKVD